MQRLSSLLRTLGSVRLAILGVVAAAMMGGFAWLIAESNAPSYSLLYSGLDSTDASQIVAQLDTAKVPYQLSRDGTSIMVPEDHVPKLRLSLAQQGLPAGGSIGYEIFDRTDALGSSNFLQNVNMVRALEGELARTIRSIDTVQSARVHLVLPQRELFSRDKQQPSASVLLQMRGHGRLDPGQITAVQRLISSAVPQLTASRVSIVDAHGTLLTGREDNGTGDTVSAGKAEESRRTLETRLSQTIEELLVRTVGPGKVRAQVFADMDFDRINTSEEIFNPDGQVVRSTQTVQEKNANTERESLAPVSVGTNLPDAVDNSGANGQSSSENRNEETVNYEISKKVINHVREAGTIKRLSVAVLIDGTYLPGADGARSYQPRPQEELDRLATLVRSAVGFNAARGDTVEVINMPFVIPEFTEAEDNGILGLNRVDFIRIAERLALLVFGILVVLLVVRPLVIRAIAVLPPAGKTGMPASLIEGQSVQETAMLADGKAPLQLPAGDGDSMIDMAQVEGRVRASSLKRVSDIVSRHPEESLAILRGWLHAEE